MLRGDQASPISIPAESKSPRPARLSHSAPLSPGEPHPQARPNRSSPLERDGNAYSDEILHAAQLSPIALTHKLKPEDWERLFSATRSTLDVWIARLSSKARKKFPEGVTAFRPEMAVHGRFGRPCPRCLAPIQRIRYAGNETNYCPVCQTGGKVLADRSLSRLLGSDWPRTLDELEALKRR